MMNKENFKLIFYEYKPDNIYLNTYDYVSDFMPGFCVNYDNEIVLMTDMDLNSIKNGGVVAYYYGTRVWITYPKCELNRNFIKIGSSPGGSYNFNDIEWSLPICLDWHPNNIKMMWNLKAFW
jgi:hypothetical protein